jgi:hypothetical protein
MRSIKFFAVTLFILNNIITNAQEFKVVQFDPISLPLIDIKIQLRNLDNNFFSAADESGFKYIEKDDGEGTIFSLFDLNGGGLASEDSIKLRTLKGDYFFYDEKGYFTLVPSHSPNADLFTIHKAIGRGNIGSNDGVFFMSSSGMVVSSQVNLLEKVKNDTELSCFEPAFILSIVNDDPVISANIIALMKSIVLNDTLQLVNFNGTNYNTDNGDTSSFNIGSNIYKASVQPSTPPPPPVSDQIEERWMTWYCNNLLDFIIKLVGYDYATIQAYLDSEAGLKSVYEKIVKRTDAINHILDR